jgi:hypothetical protein
MRSCAFGKRPPNSPRQVGLIAGHTSAARTLLEAAACAVPHGAGRYVFAVEDGSPRQLKPAEDEIVNAFRFGAKH